ncbi:hypothetical protein Ga0074812_15231 [Parafrankia irregularis]|uniref:Uncharacterized protein n=1 Tax=Parafrankia irregularis TaxID=795642 RepID=A0A0S4R0X9_9ACTN|nr:hypothetical protein Ga0074812_15231 [Parafrankia irregularis]
MQWACRTCDRWGYTATVAEAHAHHDELVAVAAGRGWWTTEQLARAAANRHFRYVSLWLGEVTTPNLARMRHRGQSETAIVDELLALSTAADGWDGEATWEEAWEMWAEVHRRGPAQAARPLPTSRSLAAVLVAKSRGWSVAEVAAHRAANARHRKSVRRWHTADQITMDIHRIASRGDSPAQQIADLFLLGTNLDGWAGEQHHEDAWEQFARRLPVRRTQ